MSIDECIKRTENNYLKEFGGTRILPKIKKITHMSKDERKKKLKEYQTRLEEIKELQKKSAKLIGLPLDDNIQMIIPVEKSSHLPKSSFEEGGLSFDFSKTPDANHLGLPLFFHKNMQILQAFADALKIHKRDVIQIFKEQRSWVVAFRYDLTIRKATFAVRNPNKKVPNPSLEPSGLVDEIYYSARSQEDLNIDENPYRKGGLKHGRNPYSDITSDQTSTNWNQANSVAGPSRSYNYNRNQQRSQGPYGNYKGKSYNPSYKRPEGNRAENFKGKGKEKM
ncbi:uncharacterized protein MELLADRAFT_58727 [Melampsora larici-populina 98AG31]|uniref:Uncharacterized protein n=1 Tax=Melampsora larici-populina (strain 98AG31 / pathotype 3-4-7) TaxID=747676 RepID=F4R4L9_MELLP|nr:uncharacterized protein MELLADRAFT_58727 [Melampsora larici-populina 98AG31]EGG12976.1 hypothetical protein MELLADRAFT_58727 [Melampsora larici-populina 98AG31]